MFQNVRQNLHYFTLKFYELIGYIDGVVIIQFSSIKIKIKISFIRLDKVVACGQTDQHNKQFDNVNIAHTKNYLISNIVLYGMKLKR